MTCFCWLRLFEVKKSVVFHPRFFQFEAMENFPRPVVTYQEPPTKDKQQRKLPTKMVEKDLGTFGKIETICIYLLHFWVFESQPYMIQRFIYLYNNPTTWLIYITCANNKE